MNQNDRQENDPNASDLLTQLGLGGDLFKSLDVEIEEDVNKEQPSGKEEPLNLSNLLWLFTHNNLLCYFIFGASHLIIALINTFIIISACNLRKEWNEEEYSSN